VNQEISIVTDSSVDLPTLETPRSQVAGSLADSGSGRRHAMELLARFDALAMAFSLQT
jgi:hypothetical protein